MRVRGPIQNTKQILIVATVIIIIYLLGTVSTGPTTIDMLTNKNSGILLLVILGQVLSIMFATILFGFLLFRFILLKFGVYSITDIKLILHSFGLGIFILTFLGFIVNLCDSYFFVLRSFSKLLTLLVLIAYIIIMYLVNYHLLDVNLNISRTFNTELREIIPMILLPYLSIFSIYLVNSYNINNLYLILILLISCIPLVACFTPINRERIIPLIFSVSMSLLFLNSLFSPYFRATDCLFEFRTAAVTIYNGFWHYNIYSNLNSMLGVAILIPMYSTLWHMDLNTVFKLLIPIFASIIPIILYCSYSSIFDSNISFLSSFLFLSLYEYYTWSGLTIKMTLAEIFLSLIIYTIVDNIFSNQIKSTLLLIYFTALTVSHYGTTYILIFCLTGVIVVSAIFRGIGHTNRFSASEFNFTLNSVLYFIVFSLSWYIYTAMSSPFITIIKIGNEILKSLERRNIAPKKSYTYKLMTSKLPEYLQILKTLYITTTLFITLGLLVVFLIKRKKLVDIKIRFSTVYILLSIFFYIIGCFVFIGNLSNAFTPDRLYQIMSFILSPFCVIGYIFFIDHITFRKTNYKKLLKLFSIFLLIFILFNTCFFAEIVWRYNVGPMISISKPRIVSSGSIYEREYLDRVYFQECNVVSALWLLSHKYDIFNNYIYLGYNANKNFILAGGLLRVHHIKLPRYTTLLLHKRKIFFSGSYIYLTKFNIKTSTIKIGGGVLPRLTKISNFGYIFNRSNRIYTNNASVIYTTNKNIKISV